MDSFQGSIPPNFISFRLENLQKENPDPSTSRVSQPAVSEGAATVSDEFPLLEAGSQTSQSRETINVPSPTLSQASECDVNAYAEKLVERVEQQQVNSSETRAKPCTVQGQDDTGSGNPPVQVGLTPENRKSSTPIPSE